MMQGPASNPNGSEGWGTLDGVRFDANREYRILINEDEKHKLNDRIRTAQLPELVEILRESFENGRTQFGQYGLDKFGRPLLTRDLERVRNPSSSPTKTARLPGEHFTPREFEALLQRFLQTGPSDLGAIQKFAINMNNMGSGLTNMTERIERFKREIPDDYFSSVSPQDLIKLANFYSPNSPEAPVLFKEMVDNVVSANTEKDRLMMVGAFGFAGQSDPIESVRRQIAAIQEKGDSEDFLKAAAIALKISIDVLESVRRLRIGALLADGD
jgi:hypothetical protein